MLQKDKQREESSSQTICKLAQPIFFLHFVLQDTKFFLFVEYLLYLRKVIYIHARKNEILPYSFSNLT